ncbi:MAG TPA: DUF4162 domain-containing protein, partial [Candidatus Limnocylindrales bacterium]
TDRVALSATGSLAAAVEALRRLEGVVDVTARDGGLDVIVPEAATRLPRLLEVAAEAGTTVRSVEVVEPDLEAVFLHLTGKALRD